MNASETSGNPTTPTKAELRSDGLKRRDRIDPDTRLRFAWRLAEVGPRLLSMFKPARGSAVASLYSPIGSEPDTMPLALALQAANVPMALPVDWSSGAPLLYRRWTPDDRLAVGPLGISEPLQGAPEVEPDILFVPAAAFDGRGHRIGYGAGNVDQTLRMFRARKRIWAIGLAYAVQRVPFVPNKDHDEPLDFVVTETGVLECGNA